MCVCVCLHVHFPPGQSAVLSSSQCSSSGVWAPWSLWQTSASSPRCSPWLHVWPARPVDPRSSHLASLRNWDANNPSQFYTSITTVLKQYRKHVVHDRKQRMSLKSNVSPVDWGDDTHSWAHSFFLFSILARACSAFSAILRSLSTCRFPSFTPAGLGFGWRSNSSSGVYTQVTGHTCLWQVKRTYGHFPTF